MTISPIQTFTIRTARIFLVLAAFAAGRVDTRIEDASFAYCFVTADSHIRWRFLFRKQLNEKKKKKKKKKKRR